jgi:hypothetical protein
MGNRFALSFFVTLALTGAAQAELIFEHLGSTNPTAEGWNQLGPFTGATFAGPVTNDLGLGIMAWSTFDGSTLDGSYIDYFQNPTPSQQLSADSGWNLSTTMRVVNSPDSPDESIFSAFFTGSRSYLLGWGSDAAGDPIVLLATAFTPTGPTGPTFTLSGYGPGYHVYDLFADSTTAGATLVVDGNVIATGYMGAATAFPATVDWGAGASLTVGHGHFSRVAFSVGESSVPEPGGLSLMFIGATAVMLRRRAGWIIGPRAQRKM